MVTGLGYYYSPLLPLITSLILIITFYLQYFLSLRINLVNAKKTWITARTRTLYMVISFLAALVSVVFYLWAVTNTDIEGKCGPFPEGDAPIYSSGIVTKDKSVSYWIFNAPIWVGIAGIKRKIFKFVDIFFAFYSGYRGNLLLHLDTPDGAKEAEKEAEERAAEKQARDSTPTEGSEP